MQKTGSFHKLVNVYAHAFFNTFADSINDQECHAFDKAHESMIKNYRLLNLLQVSFFNHHEFKKKCLDQIVKQFHLPTNIFNLGLILINSDRMHLLPFILKKVVLLYEKKCNIIAMEIRCSHDISSNERNKITKMLHACTKSNIKSIFLIDPFLIAGIRAQSTTILWEWSIRKMLAGIKAQVIR